VADKEIVLGIIPARGGSRRVPRKNIKFLGGKPLIGWTIEEAKKASSLTHVLVSTDDKEIATISKAFGAQVPFMRPEDISEDVDTGLVLYHAVQWWEKYRKEQIEFVVCLQPTSPFRRAYDIDRCVEIAKATDADTVVSVCQVTQHPAWCFEMNTSQRLTSFMNTPLHGDNLVWQKLPLLLYPNGAVYVTKYATVMRGRIYGDKIYGYLMPKTRSIDLEEELDFFTASAMFETYGRETTEWLQQSWKVS